MKSTGANLLVIRLSAIGDVALTLPVLRAVLDTYPEVSLQVLTQPFLHDLFAPLPRVELPFIDIKSEHKSLPGLLSLAADLHRTHRPDHVVDLHDVLRAKVIRAGLALRGVPTTAVKKDRAGRRRLTRKQNKDRRPVKHSVQVYADAFAKAGYPVELNRNI